MLNKLKLLGLGALTAACLAFAPKKVEACSSAIPIGRGGTNVAVADDASAVYWNPAGLVQLERPELDLAVGTSRYKGFLCYGQPLNEKSAMGINFSYRYDEDYYFDKEDLKTLWLKLGYSRKLSNKLSIGANLTFRRNYKENELLTNEVLEYEPIQIGNTTLEADLGLLYKLNDKIKLGVLLQEFGYYKPKEPNVRPGVSIKLGNKTLLAFEGYDIFGKHTTEDISSRLLRLGLERRIDDNWSIRGGIRIYKKDEEYSDKPFDGMLVGSCGISYKKGNLETSIAYFGKNGFNITVNKKF